MNGRALVTGAGISADAPACLPLGRDLEDRICRHCFEAASHVSPMLDPESLTAVLRLRCNLIARLAACAGHSVAADLLRCFRVAVPNEAHLMAAVQAARGTLHVTLNVDDGVERAYALLEGRAHLPPDAPRTFHRALDHWQRVVAPAAPLRVVTSNFAAVDYEHRPLLVKLRGSVEGGWDQSLLPSALMTDLDAQQFSDCQMVALRAAAETDHLVIAGISGADQDSRTGLLGVLQRGRFSWTSAALTPDVIRLLRSIDPTQPTLRPAVEGVRAAVPGLADYPPWPAIPSRVAGFDDHFAQWAVGLPIAAGARTYARLLSEAGLEDQAAGVEQGLLVGGP